MSIKDPLFCGFVKFIWYKVIKEKCEINREDGEPEKQYIGRKRTTQYQQLQNIFGGTISNLQYKNFKTKSNEIVNYMHNIHLRHFSNNEFAATFCKEKWCSLDPSIQ